MKIEKKTLKNICLFLCFVEMWTKFIDTVIFASSDFLLTSMGVIFSKKAILMKQLEVFGQKFVINKP